jgi:hypothetical protein
MNRLNHLLAIAFTGALLVLVQVFISRFVPFLGSGFFLVSIMLLNALDGKNLTFLSNTADGWPVPTEMGWYISAFAWWFVWCVFIFIWLLRHDLFALAVLKSEKSALSLAKIIGGVFVASSLAFPLYAIIMFVSVLFR